MKEVARRPWGRGQVGGGSQGGVQGRWVEARQEEIVGVEAR